MYSEILPVCTGLRNHVSIASTFRDIKVHAVNDDIVKTFGLWFRL